MGFGGVRAGWRFAGWLKITQVVFNSKDYVNWRARLLAFFEWELARDKGQSGSDRDLACPGRGRDKGPSGHGPGGGLLFGGREV